MGRQVARNAVVGLPVIGLIIAAVTCRFVGLRALSGWVLEAGWVTVADVVHGFRDRLLG